MSEDLSDRQKIVEGEIVSAWFERRREFSKQLLSISTLSTAGVVAFAEKAVSGGAALLFWSGVAFVIAIALVMIEMHLDSLLLAKVSDPGFTKSRTKFDPWVKLSSILACLLIIAGAVLAGCFVMTNLDLWKEVF